MHGDKSRLPQAEVPPTVLILLGCFCLVLAALGKDRALGTDRRRNLLQAALGRGRLDWLPSRAWVWAQFVLGLGFWGAALAAL